MSALVIGIDPGLGGALALLTSDGTLVDLDDMPTLQDGAAGRRAINAPLLAARVRAWGAGQAYCELVGPRPGEGAVGAFGFGRSRGIVEGVLGAQGVPVVMLAPAWWKRRVDIPPRGGPEGRGTVEGHRQVASHGRQVRPKEGRRESRGLPHRVGGAFAGGGTMTEAPHSGDALSLLQDTYRDMTQPLDVRLAAAKAAIRFEKPILASVELRGEIRHVVRREPMTAEQWALERAEEEP